MGGGQRRGTLSRRFAATAVPALEQAESREPLVRVVFKGRGVCRVSVRENEQFYCFTANDPEQMIDARDAEALLKTGLFHVPR